MATLSSASSLAAIQAEYLDTASYGEDGDVAKARRFVTACRLLILKTPKRHGNQHGDTEYSPDLIAEQLKEARDWLERNGGAPAPTNTGATASAGGAAARVTRASFQNFRD